MNIFTTNLSREIAKFFDKITIRATVQAFFIAVALFFENNLISFAASCTFGFLFSFIPIVMMIAVFLLHFLHASSDTLVALIGTDSFFSNMISVKSVLSTIDSFHGVGRFELVMLFFMAWMARNFFNSISTGIHHIYKDKITPRPVMNQIVVFGEEIFVVIVSAFLLFLSGTTKNISNLPVLFEIQSFISLHLPKFRYIIGIVEIIKKPLTKFLIVSLPYIYICAFCAVMYKGTGRERKIPVYLSFFSAVLCTTTFGITQKLMSIFININKYNVVYGVFSRLIVMLLGIYVFFILFLFFAELMFVVQFFEELLLGELFLLQNRDRTSFFSRLRYDIFVLPDYLLKRNESVLNLSDGNILYTSGEKAEFAYYIVEGSVSVKHAKDESILKQGCFFGEVSVILGKNRDNTAKIRGKTTLIAIDKSRFYNLLHKNSFVSHKVLEQICVYFSEITRQKSQILY